MKESILANRALACGAFFLLFIYSSPVIGQNLSPRQIIGRYYNVFTTPPPKTPSSVSVDAPLLGNGSSAAALAGKPELQTFYLARNDFWRLKNGFNESFPAVLGKLQIAIPALAGASYNVKQHLYDAFTIGDFQKGDTVVSMRSTLVATRDWLIVEISNLGKGAVSGKVVLKLPETDQFHIHPPLDNKFDDTTSIGQDAQGLQWIQRGFTKDVTIASCSAAACKIIGGKTNAFTLAPGEHVTLLCALSSNFKNPETLPYLQQQVQNATLPEIAQANREHLTWWHRFWAESYIHVEDSVIEHQYYRSQYNLASCSRDSRFPPGIFGSWVTQEIPSWNGDYHLNYNYSAPFYALFSSNHLQQALPYMAPIIDFLARGKYYSEKVCQIPGGALYPVGIGPLGMETTRKNRILTVYQSGYVKNGDTEDDGLFFGQKSNAAYCVTDLAFQFYKTYDAGFTRKVYPFVKAVAVFWQHYLKPEGDHYIIQNDAIHEGTVGTENPILSLGLVRMVFATAIDMSTLLGVDQASRSEWQDKCDHLAEFPTQVMHGKTVFRYTTKGVDWWSGNTLGIQHIYPAGQIGLSSDSTLLEVSRNTLSEMQRWMDFNGSNSFFPAAVRVGCNPDTILAKLHEYSLNIYPNGFRAGNPHGIENCSTVPNTINEMLCMSNQNTLRLFRVWPKERDASFHSIRCDGAFLVSSALKGGQVQFVRILSEKGRTCRLENPWPGKSITVKSNKRTSTTKTGNQIMLPTLPGEQLEISCKP